jgi:hypothetical protein
MLVQLNQYFCQPVQGQPDLDPTDNKSWVSGRSEEEALSKAAKAFGVSASQISLKQVTLPEVIQEFI